MVKNLPANAGGARDRVSIPGSERSPGVGNGKPLQYSCQENSMDRAAWRSTVHGVAEESYMREWLSKKASQKIVKERGVWHASVHGVAELDTSEQLNNRTT